MTASLVFSWHYMEESPRLKICHGGTLEGFWYSYELTTAYALTKDPGDAAALARDLKAQQVIEMRGVDEVGS